MNSIPDSVDQLAAKIHDRAWTHPLSGMTEHERKGIADEANPVWHVLEEAFIFPSNDYWGGTYTRGNALLSAFWVVLARREFETTMGTAD